MGFAIGLLILIISFMERMTNCKRNEYIACSSGLSKGNRHSLAGLVLDINCSVSIYETTKAAKDFGGICQQKPACIVYPSSVDDVVRVLRTAALSDGLTVAARGNGHSVNGQAQALHGIVLDMSATKGIRIFEEERVPYVDVRGGELWIDVLRACLKVGLAPRSWTDYLYLSIGGTLSNAGISGQTFRFGPQISNVLQLEVVTGNGEVIVCSPERYEELFYGVLGGLGQFGIITKARIILQRAPNMTRWMRLVYSDFEDFRRDQELLVSLPDDRTFDYIEGFVVVNSNDPINGWPTISLSDDVTFVSSLVPADAGPLLYCLEIALNYHSATESIAVLNKETERRLAPLKFIKGLNYVTDVPYLDFLNRVHSAELEAKSAGTWDAPHPWLNLFVPRSRIADFNDKVFKGVLKNGVGGPILLYPVIKNRWDSRMSAVVPDEDMFYLVGVLRYHQRGGLPLESSLSQNEEILRICETNGIEIKKYLPHYQSSGQWERHFGRRWAQFVERKQRYDPRAILAPGQRIFSRS